MRALRSFRFLRKLGRDRRGASLIELAMVMPILLLLLAGMVEVSRFVVARLDVELAAQRTTDYVLARRPQSPDTTYIVTEAAKAGGVDSSLVTVELFLECDGVRQDDFDGYCGATEESARYVYVAIKKPVEMQFDWAGLSQLLGMKVLSSTITVEGDSLERIQ